MPYNANTGYGRGLIDSIREANTTPTVGKVFIVCPTSHPNYQEISDTIKPDAEGQPRLFSTLAAAATYLVANRGDIVYVADGYAETITAAAGTALSIAGVTYIGTGFGANRPTFTFTTNVAASLDITAANVTVKNFVFVTGIDNQTAVNNVTAADVVFDSCEWRFSDGTVGAALCILTAATATRLKVVNSRFVGPATNAGTTLAAAIQHESGTDYVIDNNYFAGKATQMIKNVATVLRGLIRNNTFVVGTGTVAITMAAASTPFIVNNRMNVASGTAPVVAAAGFVAGNVYSAAAGVTAGTASTF